MMAVYNVSTRIRSNVPASYLLYDLCIYRMDAQRNKHLLVDVKQMPVQENYETQHHSTTDIDESLSTIYIMEVTLYWRYMLHTHCVSPEPFTKMYTLEEFATGKAWSDVKRENPCFFVTTGKTKPEREGENIVHVTISIPERPFIAKEYPIASPLDPFKKSKIREQIDDRFNGFDFPSQLDTSLCGPAAFFYCLQKDRPDVYVQAVKELWQHGKSKIGELLIAPGDGCRHPTGNFYFNNGKPRINGLDWMTMAGLRDTENTVFSFDHLDSPTAGVTLWQNLTAWFEKAGYELVFSNVGITQAGVQGIRILNEFAVKGYKVVTLINGGLLRGGNSNFTVPTHWIVWEGPVTQDAAGYISLNLFSWGKVTNWIEPGRDVQFFINRFFGGMVFKPLK